MTDNPLAALLRDVPIRGRINAGRKCLDELVSKKDVLAALTLPDMDEVVKVLERLRSVHSATDCEAAADLITALLSQRAADAARIRELEAEKRYWSGEVDTVLSGRADEYDRAEAAEARIAALRARVAGLEGGIEAACNREAETERKLRTALTAAEAERDALRAERDEHQRNWERAFNANTALEARAEAAEAEVEKLRGAGKDAADDWEECVGHVVAALGHKPDWYDHEIASIAEFRAAITEERNGLV